jgi:2-aminomuconate deaminase
MEKKSSAAIKQAIDPGASAPSPLGSYSHALRVGDLLFIAGQGCRCAQTGIERGLTLSDSGEILAYDIEAQTRGVLENLGAVLKASGLDYTDVVDVTVFLCDMKDFEAYNKVWASYFTFVNAPTRTTVAVKQLPGRNFIEMKAIATFSKNS